VSATRHGDEKFAAVWDSVQNDKKAPAPHVCSVYLPCEHGSRLAQALYQAALDDLAADVAHYSNNSGHVILAGDFNTRVGHSDTPTVPESLHSATPAFGED